jgi:uncharacterized protein (TIGR02246 family)
MKATSAERKDFISYPTNRVVGTVTDAGKARAAIGALLKAGFHEKDIDLLHGDEGLHRLDHTGAEHGFLAQFQRTMIRTLETEDFKHLTHHIEDVRSGRCVIMVLTKRREQRIVAGDILHQHGAEFVGFYGRWAWADVPPSHHMTPADVPAMYASAWNGRDPEALASLFDGDAEFVNSRGQAWHGRESIRKGHAAWLQGGADPSRLTAGDTSVKLLMPEVAVVHATMTLSGQSAADSVAPSAARTMIVSFVAHRVGERWLCASAHGTELIAEGTNVA